MIEMDETTTKLLIGAGAAIAGAIATAVAKNYTAKQRLNEIKFEYETRLNEGYLQKASDYTTSVYVPLGIELAKLNRAFQNLLSAAASKKDEAKAFFIQESQSFLEAVDGLAASGANAFYTTDLDETLEAFCGFLRSSGDTTDVQRKAFIRFGVSLIGGKYEWQREEIIRGKIARTIGPSSMSLAFPFTISYRVSDVVAAPVDTDEFQTRFARDVHFLNILIKEVTLGAKARTEH